MSSMFWEAGITSESSAILLQSPCWAGVYLRKNVYQTQYEDGEGMLPRPINYAMANASKFD
jgi:hypothetical protein